MLAQAAQRLLHLLLRFEHIGEEVRRPHALEESWCARRSSNGLKQTVQRLLFQGLKALQMFLDEAQAVLAALTDERTFRQISLLTTTLGERQQDAGARALLDRRPLRAAFDL